jgi:hypothetical protein
MGTLRTERCLASSLLRNLIHDEIKMRCLWRFALPSRFTPLFEQHTHDTEAMLVYVQH